MDHLSQIYVVFQKENFCANTKKCIFLTDQVVFLGVVSSQGVSADPNKIKVIVEWSEPCNVKEVRSFHGLATFYGQFIRNFSSIMALIIGYLKQGEFEWTKVKAFREIKARMTEAPVMRLSNFLKALEITCDASDIEI